MTRNLDVRVEVSCPIYDTAIKKRLNVFLETQWKDNVKARIIDESLSNQKRKVTQRAIRSQVELMKLILKITSVNKTKKPSNFYSAFLMKVMLSNQCDTSFL